MLIIILVALIRDETVYLNMFVHGANSHALTIGLEGSISNSLNMWSYLHACQLLPVVHYVLLLMGLQLHGENLLGKSVNWAKCKQGESTFSGKSV